MKLKNKRIFVTGGDGFIGSAISERLAQDNDVVIYDLGERGALSYTNLKSNKRCKIVKGDVLNIKSLEKASKGCDVFIHMAAIAGVSQYYSRPIRTMEVNIVGTLNLLKVASKIKPERFIYCSSSEIYGGQAYNVNENDATSQGPATQSRWTYSVSKLAGEHFAMSFAREKGLSITSLRPFNIYGPRQIHPCAVQTMSLNALRGKDIVVHNKGKQFRAWCYVEDYVDATIIAIEKKKAEGELFNIGNSRALVTIKELAERIKRISGSKSKIVYKKNPYVDIFERKPDVRKSEKVLGFKASTNLNKGLEKTISWYKENLKSFK